MRHMIKIRLNHDPCAIIEPGVPCHEPALAIDVAWPAPEALMAVRFLAPRLEYVQPGIHAPDERMAAHPPEHDQFAKSVSQALRNLHDVRRLRSSALLKCALVRAALACGDDAAMAVRRMLLESIDRLSRDPGTADQGRLLHRRYVAGRRSQMLLADTLHMGTSTLRRHVQRATALLTAELWSCEQRLQRTCG